VVVVGLFGENKERGTGFEERDVFTTVTQRTQSRGSCFFKNREIPIFESCLPWATSELFVRQATGWFFFGGTSIQRKRRNFSMSFVPLW
jgi:hypothetical protein